MSPDSKKGQDPSKWTWDEILVAVVAFVIVVGGMFAVLFFDKF